MFFIRRAGEEVTSMKLQREFGILEHVTGQDEDHAFVGLDESSFDQLFQAGERYGGGGVAPHTVSANLSLGEGNLDLAYLLDLASRSLKNFLGLFPRSWISDPDRGGKRVGLHGRELRASILADAAYERIRALGLNHGKLGQARDQAQLLHFAQRFAQGR